MPYRLPLLLRVACAVGVIVLLRAPGPASADVAKAHLSIPFTATVRAPSDLEDVNISGHLNVDATIYLSSSPLKIKAVARLAPDVTATGATFNIVYVVRGKGRFTNYWPFTPTRISHTMPLRLYSAGTSLNTPPFRLWLLQYGVNYAANGQVTSSDAAMVPDPAPGSCSTVVEVCQ